MRDHSSSESSDLPAGHQRRGFMIRFMTGALAAVLGLVPAVVGCLFFFDPLLRKRSSLASTAGNENKDSDGFIKMRATRDALPDDGTPMSFKVYDDKVDAWNKFLQVEVGTVWIRKDAHGELIAFNSICPHLGCAVDFRAGNRDFFCPCHTSAFDLNGEKTNRIPPRDMDQLQAKVKPETGETIWLKYQNFRAGTHDKIPVT